jgi:hypothetical protein
LSESGNIAGSNVVVLQGAYQFYQATNKPDANKTCPYRYFEYSEFKKYYAQRGIIFRKTFCKIDRFGKRQLKGQ